MPRTRKPKSNTASGKFRVQIGWYDNDGKRHIKSVTAATQEEARFAALEWKRKHDNADRKFRITVAAAVERYIDAKRAVLSPVTVRYYGVMYKTHIEKSPIGEIWLHDLTNTEIQIWISTLASTHSPKSVRNIYQLFRAAVEMFSPEFRFCVTLPARARLEYHCPNDEEIRRLIEAVRDRFGESSDLETAILLSAFGTLRRSEICGLTREDLEGNCIHVRRSLVQDEFGCWIEKAPKTFDSGRTVELPSFVADRLRKKKEGRIVSCKPDSITREFRMATDAAGLPAFRFHDLRHYSASIMHALGVPDQYIMERGGWTSDGVMKTVYRNVIDLEKVRQTDKVNGYFAEKFG